MSAKPENKKAAKARPSGKNQGAHQKVKSEKQVSSGSATSLTVTDAGAIKVPRAKKTPLKKAKSKPKAKRVKVETPAEENAEGDAVQEVQIKPDEDEVEPSADEKVDIEETTITIPCNTAHFGGNIGKCFVTTALDEIALEGLDGIALEALWTRLSVRYYSQGTFTRHLREYLWNNVMSNNEIRGYQLSVPRGSLKVSSEPGLSVGEELYPFAAVRDVDTKVIGSCSTYNQRKPISLQISLSEAEALGNSLVLVASQELRNNALLNPFVDPRLQDTFETLLSMLYTILEKIGRTRRQGETTTGMRSLSDVVKDSKSLFYYRNHLQKMGLISKQHFHTRSCQGIGSVSGLLHLRRFYTEVKSRRQTIMEFVIRMIKQKPEQRMEYMELRRALGTDVWENYQMGKIIKLPEFRQFVKTDVAVPYRTMYPNATAAEWKHKAKDVEKVLRILELRNPNLNINSVFKDRKDEKDESSDSEDDSHSCFGEMSARRIYQAVREAGPQGITMRSICKKSSCDHYIARNVTKKFVKSGFIKQTLQDSKRQHYMVYVATGYLNTQGLKKCIKSEAGDEEEDAIEENDDIYEFIGTALNVDSNALKVKPVFETNNAAEQPCSSEYFNINELRRAKDKDKLKTYFENRQSFEPKALQLLKNIDPELITKYTKSEQLFSSLSENPRKSKSPFVPLTRSANKCSMSRYKVKKHHVRRLKSAKPFRRLLRTPFKIKTIDAYVKSTKSLNDALSSSDDEPLEDLNSVESVKSGLHETLREVVPAHVKEAIIKCFEQDSPSLRDVLNEGADSKVEAILPDVSTAEEMRHAERNVDNYFNVPMEMYMGPKPRILSVTKDAQDIETMLVMSTHPNDFTMWRPLLSNSQRVQSRIRIIKEAVYKQKTIIDLIKIHSIISQTEAAEGYFVKVDRKSLQRIITTLVKEGGFIIVKIIVKFRNVVRQKNVIAEANCPTEVLIQSMVDQFKNSFIMYAKRKLFDEEEKSCVVRNKIKKRFRYDRLIGRVYGASPKIAKMRIMHEFLFYLIRGFSGSPIPKDKVREALLHHCDSDSVDDVVKESTTLYQHDATWRMFVAPLPQHKTWPNGWALISDVLLRMPVSLFVKVYNVSYIIPELPRYLNHPVRKHFIVKDMPSNIKDALLGYRKYIFSIHEIICYLAYLGLVQFGPQKMREKDQVFIYLNTKAMLYDTTTSEQGYHHVSKKEYPLHRYEFERLTDVEKYWSDMYLFAINTNLGYRASVIGQSIKLEYVHAKTALTAALKPQTAESALKNDIGYLPGDKLGACGSDSAIWLHVQKNWHWHSRAASHNSNNLHPITGLRRKHLEDVKEVKISDIHTSRRRNNMKMIRAAKRPGVILKETALRKQQARGIKRSVIMRKVQPRKALRAKRIRVDLIDKKIVEKMGKSRAIFTAEEDKLILVCMDCHDYLTALNKKRAVGSIAIRDFIHRMMPMCTKKTSMAYRRRATQLRKRKNLDDHSEGITFNLAGHFFVGKHFGKIRNDMQFPNKVGDSQLNNAFLYLADYAWKERKLMPERKSEDVAFIDRLKPGSIENFVVHTNEYDQFYRDPRNENEINMDVIQSVIQSSLSSQQANEHWPYQLLKIYQTFPEDLLRVALVNMRDHQIISGRKLKNGGTILMSGVTYNLSFNYTFKQITQFPHCIFIEADEVFRTMIHWFDRVKEKGFSFEQFEHGNWLALGEFQTTRTLNWKFDFPDDIITLNPKLHDFSELIKELMQRYTRLMKKSQESEDAPFDPNMVKQWESILSNFIQDQHKLQTSTRDPSSVDSSTEKSQDQFVEPMDVCFPMMETEPSTSNQLTGGQTDSFQSDVTSSSGYMLGDMDLQESSEERIFKNAKFADFGNFGKADRRHRTWRISDMAFMLTKGLFPELDDDERLEKLNEHFIVRYPTCRIRFDELQTSDDDIFRNWHEDIKTQSAEIMRSTLNDAVIDNNPIEQKNLHLDEEGREIANFICSKNILGASSVELKGKFPGIRLPVLQHLTDIGLVLRVGVCNHAFVHHKYRHAWTIYLYGEKPMEEIKTGGKRLRIRPWMRINGTLDENLLDKWLSIILSHCLSFPCITFNRLCARFNIIKPVDIYYILEILQRLRCLRIWSYARNEDKQEDIFNDFEITPQVPGSMLDDFDDVFVETDSSAITKFGAFLNRHKTDFAYAFEEEE